MSTPTKWGTEFLVNTYTFGDQDSPAVTGLADGRFVMTWTDQSGELDDSDEGVHAQIFNADGTRAGAEFLANTTISGSQFQPQAAGLPDGRFVVTWVDSGSDDIWAQEFNPDGTTSRPEFKVNTQTADLQFSPAITALADGRFVVTWTTRNGSDTDIHAQAFKPNGTTSGQEFVVNTFTPNKQAGSAITGLSDGRFVVAWDHAFSPTDHDIHAQIFDSNDNKDGPELLVNSAMTQDFAPAVTALADGRFVVSWAKDAPGGSDIHAQLFDANGAKSGGDFLVNTTTAADQFQSVLAGLPDGRFVAAWTDPSHTGDDGSGFAIRAQLFNADGTKPGAEFLVNATTIGDQLDPSITVLADGRFVVGWSDASQTGGDQSGSAVRAQIFDPRESGVSLNGTALNDHWVGTNFGDTMRGEGGDDQFDSGGGDGYNDFDGGEGDDTLNGGDGSDVFKGGNGNDTLNGRGGYNALDGGAGDDTAVFAHNFNDYTVWQRGPDIGVKTPDGGETTLIGIEHLRFADVTITPVDDGNALFDALFYLSRNPDVFHAGVDPLEHFNTFGWHEGRDPNIWFDVSGYLAVNKDVAAAGVNPLEHYHQSGWHEGRDPSAGFDTKLYLLDHPDVAAAGVDPLAHYLQFLLGEPAEAVGEAVNGFDAQYYLFHNPDVAAAGVDALEHFNIFGWHEGRKANAWFDTVGYLAHYADVAAAGVNPLEHYETFGWKEGRDPSADFDTLGYLAANPDVAAAHVNPLDHFLMFGIYEGRAAVNDGMWH